MPLPCHVCYRIEPNTTLALVIPGRRIPEKMTLWLDFQGVMELLQAAQQGAIMMDKTEDAVWGMRLDVLRMKHGDEPVMYSAQELAEMAAARASGRPVGVPGPELVPTEAPREPETAEDPVAAVEAPREEPSEP